MIDKESVTCNFMAFISSGACTIVNYDLLNQVVESSSFFGRKVRRELKYLTIAGLCLKPGLQQTQAHSRPRSARPQASTWTRASQARISPPLCHGALQTAWFTVVSCSLQIVYRSPRSLITVQELILYDQMVAPTPGRDQMVRVI